MWINNNNLNKYTGGECQPRWSPECWTESVSRLYEQYGADKITYILASWCSILMVALLTAIYFAFSERKARRSISLTENASNNSNRGKKRAVGVNKNHKSRKKSSTSTNSSDSETEPIYQKNFRTQSQNDRDMVVCSTPTEVVSRPVQVMTSSPISITAPSKFSADKNPNIWLEEFDLYCEASSCRQNKHKILLYYLDKETREMVEDYGYSEDSELAYMQMVRQLKKYIRNHRNRNISFKKDFIVGYRERMRTAICSIQR
jgi:hypothetical protein